MIPVKPAMKKAAAALPNHQPRVLSVNSGHVHKDFKDNFVSTTKYNIATYLPKALFEQFRREPWHLTAMQTEMYIIGLA